jgi:hypothetical protein
VTYSFPGEDEDLDAMLDDSPHRITVSGATQPCFYELRGELGEEAGGAASQVLQMEVATVKAAHFPDIAEGSSASISGPGLSQDYTVLRIIQVGSMTELLLQRA